MRKSSRPELTPFFICPTHRGCTERVSFARASVPAKNDSVGQTNNFHECEISLTLDK